MDGWIDQLIFFSPWVKAGFFIHLPEALTRPLGPSSPGTTHFWIWWRTKNIVSILNVAKGPGHTRPKTFMTFQKPPPFLLWVGFSQSRLRFPGSTKLYLNSARTLNSTAQIYFLASNDVTNTRWQLPHPASFSFLSQRLCSGTSPARGCCWH